MIMIDKNKRAKAARQISEKVVDAKGFDNSKPTHLAFLEGHIDGFNAGAKWAINEFLKDLWHPSSEKPEKRNENIIVLQDEDDEDESNPLYAAILHERHDTFPWDEYCEDNAIYKWCYFKEIAPKKGDKNE